MFQNLWDIENFYAQCGASRFSIGFFGLPVLKIFVGNHFNLTGNFGYRNFLCMRTEKLVSPPKFLCLTIPKKFVVTTSKFQIIWDLENSLSYHDFPSKFLSHNTEKLREEPSSVSEIFKREVTKKVMNKNGISQISVESFLSEGAENFRWGTLRIPEKFGYRRISCLRGWYHFSPMNFFHLGCL